ncbi:hypothetical protein ABZ800_15460 [Streptomyces sp. NPDC047813]|uniref:hypothetical protein n=1 Tax=Streptomyces sp. NPDC047813 TaxID=3154608 RepID=UPI0033D15E75
MAMPIMLGGGLGAAPIVSTLRQDYLAGLIAGAPSFAAALLIFFLVICPAVWSKSPARQSAALAVLDRLLGRQDDSRKPRNRRSDRC